MSAGQVIEIYKEVGLPRAFAERVRARRLPRHARARPHADGDREPRHDRGLAPVLDGPRPLPRAQRLALEPQPPARRACGARASSSRPRTTPRSRPGYLTWRLREGASLEQALEGCLDDLDGFYTFARRHGRRLRGAARPDRVQAGGARRDRRLGRDGVRVPRDRRPARRRRRADVGAGAGRRLRLGEGAGRDGGRRRRPTSRSSTSRRRRCASSTSGCTTSPATTRSRGAGASSTRTARTRSPAASTRRSRSRSTATSGYYCAGMNKRATVRVHGNAGTGRRREHDVRHGRRRGQRQPVGRRDRPRRAARRPRRRRRRAAASR